MRHTLNIALLAAALTLGAAVAPAQTKLEKRHAYTLRHLKLDRQTQARFSPVLRAYLTDKKAAGKKYDDLKEKYKSAEKAGTITDAQATQLLEAKLECSQKELDVKRKYYAEFRKILKPKKVYYAFDLAGDKMSKVEGKE